MIIIIDDGDVDLLGTVLQSSVASADGTNLNEDGFIAFGEVVVDQVKVEEALRLPVRIVGLSAESVKSEFRWPPMVSRVMVVLSVAEELGSSRWKPIFTELLSGESDQDRRRCSSQIQLPTQSWIFVIAGIPDIHEVPPGKDRCSVVLRSLELSGSG